MDTHGYYPVPFLTPGGGINLSLWSYREQLCFGILGCPDKTGDLWQLSRYVAEAVDELSDAVARVSAEEKAALNRR